MKTLLLFSIGILLLACNQEKNVKVTEPRQFEDWVELVIPNVGETYGIAGDIDDTLLVSTDKGVYITADKGKTWTLSKELLENVLDIAEHEDTVFLLTGYSVQNYMGPLTIKNTDYATYCYDFSTDYGKTWHKDPESFCRLSSPIGIANSTSGSVCRLHHYSPTDSPEIESTFSNVELYMNSTWKNLNFPLKYNLNNIHIDKMNRLYISANTWSYMQDLNIKEFTSQVPGLVYMYKHRLP